MLLKQLMFFLMFIILFSCGETLNKNKKAIKKENTKLFIDLDGNEILLSKFKGKRVLVNYWATWCTPCLEEMPSLVLAQEILKNENYVFLFPTTDAIIKIKEFQKIKNYPLQFLNYPSTLDKLNIYALPATFIYNTKGEIVKRIDGATTWNSNKMINLLKSIE